MDPIFSPFPEKEERLGAGKQGQSYTLTFLTPTVQNNEDEKKHG